MKWTVKDLKTVISDSICAKSRNLEESKKRHKPTSKDENYNVWDGKNTNGINTD